jgi:hypothetical protein
MCKKAHGVGKGCSDMELLTPVSSPGCGGMYGMILSNRSWLSTCHGTFFTLGTDGRVASTLRTVLRKHTGMLCKE